MIGFEGTPDPSTGFYCVSTTAILLCLRRRRLVNCRCSTVCGAAHPYTTYTVLYIVVMLRVLLLYAGLQRGSFGQQWIGIGYEAFSGKAKAKEPFVQKTWIIVQSNHVGTSLLHDIDHYLSVVSLPSISRLTSGTPWSLLTIFMYLFINEVGVSGCDHCVLRFSHTVANKSCWP